MMILEAGKIGSATSPLKLTKTENYKLIKLKL